MRVALQHLYRYSQFDFIYHPHNCVLYNPLQTSHSISQIYAIIIIILIINVSFILDVSIFLKIQPQINNNILSQIC